MHENIVLGESVITPWMSIKNPTEIQHFKDVMVKDGVALVKLYRWLEDTLGNRSVKETEVAEQLAKFRSEQEGYKGESFPAIVGYEANGAIVHYRAKEEDCASIEKSGMLLLDSGGQYINGTTDITRTVHFGTPTPEQRKHYTLVLKGNIALQTVHFPKGITGAQLDTLARFPLWREGLNYGHGTGHGVGFFLGVHESPQGFAPNIKSPRGYTPIEENTVTSNEPGYYQSGDYGIRIENLMQCVPSDKNPDFLAFEVLTLFPIATNMIDNSLLNYPERVWLNRYHRRVYSALSPHLAEKDRAWLWNHCQAI
jgi:Xaa-Pro aminopeptidase